MVLNCPLLQKALTHPNSLHVCNDLSESKHKHMGNFKEFGLAKQAYRIAAKETVKYISEALELEEEIINKIEKSVDHLLLSTRTLKSVDF